MSAPSIVYNPFTENFDFIATTGGSSTIDTVTGNDSVAVIPSGGNVNIVGSGSASFGVSAAGNIYTTGSGATLTINETQAQFLTNYTSSNVDSGHSPYTAVATDYYISVDCSGGVVTIRLPNAPTNYRMFIIKDRTGNAQINNITVTTVGGVVTIDGVTSYVMNEEYESANITFNGTSYEVF